MIVLGIDSATTTGWALIERRGMAERLIDRGHVKLNDKRGPAAVVEELAARVWNAVEPDLVVIEQPWLGKNAKTALLLAEFIGRWRQAFEARGCRCEVIAPATWHAGILRGLVGMRSPRAACKKAAQIWARSTYRVTMTEDEADAAAVATWAARVRSSTMRSLGAA